MGAFEELLESWRSNPSSDSTIALCSYLSQYPREDLVREVGSRAEQWHSLDGGVMLAVGRMYLEGGLFAEAQSALVLAGKADARDPRPFRYLGEVLLRRGDAMRGEKVLARAMELGANDGDTRLWHDRSVVYVALQKRVGSAAVAAEVARTLPAKASMPPPPAARAEPAAPTPRWGGEEPPTIPKAPPHRMPPGARPPAGGGTGPVPVQARPRSVPPPLPQTAPPAPAIPPPAAVPAPGAVRRAAFDDDDGETTVQNRPSHGAWMLDSAPVAAPPPGSAPGPKAPTAPAPPPVPPAPPVPPRAGAPPRAFAPSPPVAEARPAPPTARDLAAVSSPVGGGWSAPTPDVSRPEPPAPARLEVRGIDDSQPAPEMVLEHLARVGIYEPGGGAPPAWERAVKVKTRGNWVLLLATVLVLGIGGGGYAYARKVKLERIELAKRIGDEVETMLHTGEIDDLRATDDKLARMFELDSRSQRAARMWLENRVLGALMLPDEPRGIDAAVHRTRTVELPEEDAAFGRIASFLVEGDLAGAAALLPKWDKKAGKDGYYHLVAGAALERAGDLRSIERYQAARSRDTKLILADVLLARAVLLELGAEKGKPLVAELKKKGGDTPSYRALLALAWAVDPARSKEPPAEAKLGPEASADLILPLRPVPSVVEALTAIEGGQSEKAREAIDSAIALTVSPSMATQLGFLAIKTGDEKLARKAALRALQFSALYPKARVLASRVALLGGRLDEAKKAIEELDPKSAEVAVVRAVLAYETLDAGEMQAGVDALGDAAKEVPDFAALAAGPRILRGEGYPEADALAAMASPSVPWGELIAVDGALDTGNLELADKLVTQWGQGAERAVYALRVARLERSRGKPDEADKASSLALARGTTTVTVLVERVYALVEKGEAKAAKELIAKYQSLLGPLADWLRVFVDGSSGRAAEAKIKAGQLELLPDGAPLVLRVLSARALAVAKDRRAKAVVGALSKQLPKHPDVLKAVEAVK